MKALLHPPAGAGGPNLDKALQRTAYLKEKIIERCKVEAIALSYLPGLMLKLNFRVQEALVRLIHLIMGLYQETNMEICWIRRQLFF